MTLQLADLTDSLKRAVAVPGDFDASFANMGPNDILGSLMDGFAEAQLDGFFGDYTFDTNTGVLSIDLPPAYASLVVIYSSTSILRSMIRNLKSHIKYVGGPVSFEQDQSASVLVQELKAMTDRVKTLRDEAKRAGAGQAFHMADRYFAMNSGMYGTFADYADQPGLFGAAGAVPAFNGNYWPGF